MAMAAETAPGPDENILANAILLTRSPLLLLVMDTPKGVNRSPNFHWRK
ncbi:hypothetical protein K3495_g7231 [Podosphaera aphanis]|nr:hypothetical protein K3495_g7231 [Podosphaera aphanis]